MNDNVISREFIIVLSVMAALLIFGIVAVMIFIRTWRKEIMKTRAGKNK